MAEVPAPLPADEAQRLAALHALAVLDTPPEERFDAITRTARRLLATPIAMVTLVDASRQWFKSCQGLSLRETDRGVSFCAYAIHTDEPFVIPDATADARFAGNPLVTGPPFIRAYAGVPVHAAGGQRVGTLCVLDRRPRVFSPDELDALRDLARWAEGELNRSELAAALTARREAQEAVERLRRHQGLILEAALEGVCGIDPEGMLVFANPAARRLFGLAPDEPLDGVHLHSRFHALRPDGSPYPWEDCPSYKTLHGGGALHVRDEVFWSGGCTPFPVEYSSAPIVEGGRVTGAVVTFNDVTERRAIERMKDEFVSVVSHELRTPLTSIRGSLGLLASGALGPLGPDAQRMAEVAVSSTDRLVRLVNDILDLERIESGTVELQRTVTSVEKLLREAAAAVEGAADHAGVEVRLHPVDGDVDVDRDRMVQAIANLLSNAIKFSAAGQAVDVFAERHVGTLTIRVVDRGRGIPQEMQERIFERFQQVDASDSGTRGGTGLGLAIVRSIVGQHGGSVSVESAPGAGSSFTVSIPTGPVDAAAERERTARPVVLVVEDDGDLVEVLRLALARRGVEVVGAVTEGDAVALAQQVRPAAIVLDVVLAEGDGYGVVDALRRIRALASTPVVVFTGHDLDEHQRSRLRLGPTELLLKCGSDAAPVEETVLRLIGLHADESRERVVLVIDDDDEIRDVAQVALEQIGHYTVVTADTGEEGIRLAHEHQPDAILLDVMMPGMDGPATLQRLRADPTLAGVPVLFLTAKAQASERERLQRLGPSGMLAKPFDPIALPADLARLLGWK